MLTIRLLRTGKKNQPSYKVVVTDKRNPPKGGKSVEEVGFFNPKTKEKQFNKERILYWLSVGAQPSDTIHNMLVNEKIIDQPKRKIIFTKKPVVAEEAKSAEHVETTKAEPSPAPVETPKEETPAVETEPVAEETKKEELTPVEPIVETATTTEEPKPAEDEAESPEPAE